MSHRLDSALAVIVLIAVIGLGGLVAVRGVQLAAHACGTSQANCGQLADSAAPARLPHAF